MSPHASDFVSTTTTNAAVLISTRGFGFQRIATCLGRATAVPGLLIGGTQAVPRGTQACNTKGHSDTWLPPSRTAALLSNLCYELR